MPLIKKLKTFGSTKATGKSKFKLFAKKSKKPGKMNTNLSSFKPKNLY